MAIFHKSSILKQFYKRRTPPGSSPGTFIVDPLAPKPVVTVIAYNEASYIIEPYIDNSQIDELLKQWNVVWINVAGLGELSVLKQLADAFAIHPLALEDVINVHQRPKVEDYPHHNFIVVRQVMNDENLKLEQVSIFLGKGYVLSFLERPTTLFNLVQDRIRHKKSRVRQLSADYLAYELIDAIVDSYYPVLEYYAEALDDLEDEILVLPSQALTAKIHSNKHELLTLKRAVWSQRDALLMLHRSQSNFISHETMIYLRDCYDHSMQILELLEAYREHASNLMDVYLSSLNYRMNETMKVLTIIATIFIPMGFFASLWGMNFKYMPELDWHWGYPMALCLMVVTAAIFIIYFWRKGWLSYSK